MKGVRIKLQLGRYVYVDINSLLAHHQAAMVGGITTYDFRAGEQTIQLSLEAVEIDESFSTDEPL